MGCVSNYSKRRYLNSHPLWTNTITGKAQNATSTDDTPGTLCYIVPPNIFCIYDSNRGISHEIHNDQPLSLESGLLLLASGLILSVGGVHPLTNEETNECSLIDPKLLTFLRIRDLPCAKRRLRLLESSDSGEIFSVGGVNQVLQGNCFSLSYENNCFSYNLETRLWATLPDLAIGVEYPGCYIYNSALYATGGARTVHNELHTISSIQFYFPGSANWEISAISLPVAVFYHLAVPVDNEHILVMGGMTEEEEITSTFLVSPLTYETISSIPMGTSTLFPYYSITLPGNISAINEDRTVLEYNRLTRKWTALNKLLNSCYLSSCHSCTEGNNLHLKSSTHNTSLSTRTAYSCSHVCLLASLAYGKMRSDSGQLFVPW